MDAFLQLMSAVGSMALLLVLLLALAVMPYRMWQLKRRNNLREELEAMEDELALWRANRLDERR